MAVYGVAVRNPSAGGERPPLSPSLLGLPGPDVDLDVDQPRLLDLRDVLSLQESAADSGGPDRDILPSGRQDVLVHDCRRSAADLRASGRGKLRGRPRPCRDRG